MQSEAPKSLRVIVWNCESEKILYDEQTNCFMGCSLRDDNASQVIFAGKGDKLQKRIAIREIMNTCRRLKRIIRREIEENE